MNTPITFTPATLIGGFLAFCAGLSCIAGAAGWVIKMLRAAKAPAKRVDERLGALESTVEDYREYFDNDQRRMEAIEVGSRVTQKALLALLSHGIDGNDVDAMRAAKAELQEYLIERN